MISRDPFQSQLFCDSVTLLLVLLIYFIVNIYFKIYKIYFNYILCLIIYPIVLDTVLKIELIFMIPPTPQFIFRQ